MRRYLSLHLQNLIGSLGRAARQPFATALTVLVIALALALPSALRVFVNNIDVLSGSWEGIADVTVFLDTSVGEDRAAQIANELEGRPDVASVRLVTRDDALEEFRAASGFGEALDALEENPLPHTLIVRPTSGAMGDVEALAGFLENLEETELVQLDTDWLARLRSIIELARRVVALSSALLGLAVIVVIGNTIRLEINNRRTEIEVMKLVGGSDAFIRRPFLYQGFWFGLLGAVFAALIIGVARLLLDAPVARLAGLYGSTFRLSGLSWGELAILHAAGPVLGVTGAAIAAARHLRAIEPT
jgi:cell division transport system permease protein